MSYVMLRSCGLSSRKRRSNSLQMPGGEVVGWGGVGPSYEGVGTSAVASRGCSTRCDSRPCVRNGRGLKHRGHLRPPALRLRSLRGEVGARRQHVGNFIGWCKRGAAGAACRMRAVGLPLNVRLPLLGVGCMRMIVCLLSPCKSTDLLTRCRLPPLPLPTAGWALHVPASWPQHPCTRESVADGTR